MDLSNGKVSDNRGIEGLAKAEASPQFPSIPLLNPSSGWMADDKYPLKVIKKRQRTASRMRESERIPPGVWWVYLGAMVERPEEV